MKTITVILFAFLLTIEANAENRLKIMTEEFAPYQFYTNKADGKKVLTGISYEIVQSIQKRIGNTEPIDVLPWSRALKLLRKKENTFLFSTARTPEREDKYKWIGPLAPLEMVFFKRVDSDIQISSMEEAKTINKIGVTKNVATHEILTNLGFTNLDVMQSGADEKNLKRLLKKRIDVWPTVYYAGTYSAKKVGALNEIEVIPGVKIMSGHLYIAVNKNTDDRIIHQWQSALDSLRAEGVIAAIIKKYES